MPSPPLQRQSILPIFLLLLPLKESICAFINECGIIKKSFLGRFKNSHHFHKKKKKKKKEAIAKAHPKANTLTFKISV